MFLVDRSALAVLLPITLLLGVVLWSNHSAGAERASQQAGRPQAEQQDQTVAANLPSR